MINKEYYCNFISAEGKKLEKVYSDLWTAGLINEKNLNKSPLLHKLFTDSDCKLIRWHSGFVFLAIVKYIKFIFAKLFFSGKKKIDNDIVVFSYGGNHLRFFTDNVDSVEIVFPQETEYKKSKESVTIYSFVSWWNFVLIPFLYIATLFKLLKPSVRKNILYNSCIYKKDFLRSFAGDVCVENLFYSAVFKRLNKLINKNSKVYYIHEGLGWEKLLCKYLSNYKTGIVCSIVSENLINFFSFDKHEPDTIGVLSNKQKQQFSKQYSNVFVYGSGRYNYLKVRKPRNKKNILIILPYNIEMANQLLNFVKQADIAKSKTIYVRKHPKIKSNIKTNYKLDTYSLSKSMEKAEIVITTGDTSTVFDAVAYNCLVVIVDLKGFVQLSCLANDKLTLTVTEPNQLKSFIKSDIDKLRLAFNNRRVNRQKLLNQYFDFSFNEKQMTDRILNASSTNNIL